MRQARVQANMLTKAPMSMSGTEDGKMGEGGKRAEGSFGFAEVLMELAEAEGFGVAADEEEDADEDGGLDDGSGDGAEGVAGFVAEGGGGFEAGEAEEGEDDSEANAGGSDAGERGLGRVDVDAGAEDEGEDDERDHGDGRGFDPQHHAGGGLDVAVGKPCGGTDGDQREQRRGDGVGRGNEDDRIVDEAADDGDCGGGVGEQQRPSCGASSNRRKRIGGVLVERAG